MAVTSILDLSRIDPHRRAAERVARQNFCGDFGFERDVSHVRALPELA
jgi:hypothetical protein